MGKAAVLRLVVVWTIVSGLLYAQVGFMLRYEAQRASIQRGIKDRIRQGIPVEELTRFSMPAAEWKALNWVKPKREFRLQNGDMYDVVHVAIHDDMVDALCVHDRDETLLFAGLKDHMRRIMDGPDPETGGRSQIARLLAQLDIPPSGLALSFPLLEDRTFARSSATVLEGPSSRWTPPPETGGGSPSPYSRSFR